MEKSIDGFQGSQIVKGPVGLNSCNRWATVLIYLFAHSPPGFGIKWTCKIGVVEPQILLQVLSVPRSRARPGVHDLTQVGHVVLVAQHRIDIAFFRRG